ncbi:MAG: HD domain-containing protein [Lachnospiraceae bacterium]|nr:HD domain-containing protein [Lachnospiraceae bacterium]
MSTVSIMSVCPGMVLDAPVYDEENKKLLLSAGVVLTESNILQLVKHGFQTLEIADRFTRFIGPYEKMSHYLKKTYERFIEIYASEKEEENLCDEMLLSTRLTKQAVDGICDKENVLNLCMLMHIQSNDRLFQHAVLTSVFSGLLAGSLHLSDVQIENTMLGGLLHNIGVLEMAYLIPKKDKLHGQEELLWKEHPEYGYYLSIQEGISRDVSNIILTHHERWDGSGYPNHLKGEEIPLETRIVSVCSSITDFIVFRDQQPYEAMEYLYGTSNMYFDKNIVDTFAASVTMYPLGTLVRLTTGEVGVVSNVRKNRGPRPIVNVYFNRFHKPYSTPKMVDLGKERTVFISQILAF